MAKDKLIDAHKDGIALMRAAMDKYENGEIEDAHSQMERAFDMITDADAPYTAEMDKDEETPKTEDAVEYEDMDDDALYGESRNFGIIYRVLQEAMGNSLFSKKGKNLIKDTIKTIKSDKILKEEYYLYNTLSNAAVTDNVDEYVNEMAYEIKNYSKETLAESNEKLLRIVKENKLNELIDIPDEDIELFESIDNLFTTKKKLDNINRYVSAKNRLKECLEKRQKSKLGEGKDKRLTEDELKLVEALNDETSDKEKLFYYYKDNTISKVNEMMSSCTDEDKEKMINIMSTLVESKYNEETVIDDVLKFITIQETIEE